jgi:hypothetical protein
MVLIEDFSHEKIAEGIIYGLNKKWDSDKISERNKLFNWESRCLEYRKIFNEIKDSNPNQKHYLIDDLIKLSKSVKNEEL